MSALKRILSKQSKGKLREDTITGDLERGQDLVPSSHYPSAASRVYQQPPKLNTDQPYHLPATAYQPIRLESLRSPSEHMSLLPEIDKERHTRQLRTSFSDSEFSQTPIPVSPERYEEALQVIEGDSPRTPTRPRSAAQRGRFEEVDAQQRPEEVFTFPPTSENSQQTFSDDVSASNLHSPELRQSTWSPAPSDDGLEQLDPDSESYYTSNISDKPSQNEREQAPFIGQAERLAVLNPGSSQTSSSLSTGQLGSTPSGRRGGAGFYEDSSSSSKLRSPTPPLLFGRPMLSSSEHSDLSSRFTFNRHDSDPKNVLKDNGMKGNAGVEKAVKDITAKDGGRSKREVKTGSGEQDWVTVSDTKGLTPHPAEDIVTDAGTGSSLADFSDSGNRSLDQSKEPKLGSIIARRFMQRTGAPRYHQAYMFMKDERTGEVVSVPQNRLEAGNTYQHPIPLPADHPHPLTSAERSFLDRISQGSILTDSFNEMVAMHGSSHEAHTGEKSGGDSSHTRDVVSESSESQKKDMTSSSGWMSTISEVNSGDNSPRAIRTGSFAKVTVLSRKANLTGTPEGTGAREVGSSLAGASSPPSLSVENLHPTSLVPTPTHQPPQSILLATPETSSSATSNNHIVGSRGPSKARRRRSSSESNYKVIESPSATQAPALPPPSLRIHKKCNTMPGLFSSGNSSFCSDEDSKDSQYEPILRERKSHQASSDHDSISRMSANTRQDIHISHVQTSQIPTSTIPNPFVHGSEVSTNAARSRFVHPVYGLERPWDVPTQNRSRPQARPDRYQRPIARVESPHLYQIPHSPTAAIRKRQENISKFWLPIFCVVPPVALIFGHGYADEIIRMQTGGEIEDFAASSKTLALQWGYGITPFMVLGVVLAAILGGFS